MSGLILLKPQTKSHHNPIFQNRKYCIAWTLNKKVPKRIWTHLIQNSGFAYLNVHKSISFGILIIPQGLRSLGCHVIPGKHRLKGGIPWFQRVRPYTKSCRLMRLNGVLTPATRLIFRKFIWKECQTYCLAKYNSGAEQYVQHSFHASIVTVRSWPFI